MVGKEMEMKRRHVLAGLPLVAAGALAPRIAKSAPPLKVGAALPDPPFELTTKDDQTVLHFTHDGLVPEKECYALCSEGWNTVVKNYLFYLITEDKSHF